MRWNSKSAAQAGSGVDLTPLSDREREILALLAEGHTAKSISADTGYSIASINERLRQARRKTGVASSRELARLFAARKNRHGQIDLAAARPPEAARRLPILLSGAIAMMLFAITAAALVLNQTAPSPGTAATPGDPLIDSVLPQGEGPHALAERLRGETRDAGWAGPAETALRERYASLIDARRVEILQVRCGATLCEIAGRLLETGAPARNATMRELQNPARNALPDRAGLKLEVMTFGPEGGFAAHWLRG